MKQFIFILLSVALFIGCQDSNSVEPISDFSDQINKFEEDPFVLPILDRNGEEKAVKCNYDFNPSAHCGGLLNGCNLKYRYESISSGVSVRYLRNVEYWAPSTMNIGKETIQTCNIYTLNKTEIIGLRGKIIGGEAWGTFQVKAATGDCQFDVYESTEILFEGKFSGEVKDKVTNVKMFAKGQNHMTGRNFIAKEVQACSAINGKLNCISSEIIGKVTPVIKVDE